MAIQAANMDECTPKARCINGPNEGLAYDKDEPCPPDLYVFNPSTCDCDPLVGYETWRFYQRTIGYLDGRNCCEIGPELIGDVYAFSRTFGYGAAVALRNYVRFGVTAGYYCSNYGTITVADITGAKWCVIDNPTGGYAGLVPAATQAARVFPGTYLEDSGAGITDSVWAVMTYLCDVTLNGYQVKAGDTVSTVSPPGTGTIGGVECVFTHVFIDGAEGVGNQATCP